YDYYQPEAYVPHTDTYIEKEVEINEEIDKLRLSATANLLTRPDTIVVSSVSCIYNLGSPVEYGKFALELQPGAKISMKAVMQRLSDLQYERNEYTFKRGSFRVRGDTVDIFPAYKDFGLEIEFFGDNIRKIAELDPLTGNYLNDNVPAVVIYPAKHYMTDPTSYDSVFPQIQKDMQSQVEKFKAAGKLIEAQRIEQRTRYDLEMIREVGYVNGIENYTRYFDGRNPGDPPYTLVDYFAYASKDWLLIIDESHITLPQIRGMYNGDRARKETLIDYGFRLPSALDNRPLRYDEFMRLINKTIYVSATPDEYELSLAAENENGIAEQLIRPTGLIDPLVTVKPTKGQIPDLITEINKRVTNKQRILVTTLTKRMAEELTSYLEEKGIKVAYLHSDIETFERQDILDSLREGVYDVLVGINLLREGLDLPEVSLVAILDADKEGFLRSRSSLIQTMGRAARHIDAAVIMYADKMTKSMQAAIDEVTRRRNIQLAYNKKHSITPKGIQKGIRAKLVDELLMEKETTSMYDLAKKDVLLPDEKEKLLKMMRSEMKLAATELDFETAAILRDKIKQLKS
nr:excinuclease ABC subunit UvrB [Candidatus Levybacteria bacterium]